MAKRKTQIERAVESMEADRDAVIREHDLQIAALNAAIEKVRQQGQKVKRKPRKPIDGVGVRAVQDVAEIRSTRG